jgi:hypothetical protein
MSLRVTVLLAVHNGEPWIRRCVESVLAQTFTDFELLVVDDASTDATVATIESFGDERIRILVNETNRGQVPSLNRGLREARGEVVARIDADDWCLPERLERQVAVLDAEPHVGLVGTWLDAVDADGRPVDRLTARLDSFAEFVYATLIMRVYVSHPAAAYRLAPVLALGGYDESTGPAEDKDLWRRLALERWDARIVPEPLVVYRLHDRQLSQVQAAYQRDVDGRSQERFLAALAPDAPLRPLRLLLAADGDLWREPVDPRMLLAGLELLLAGARERLRLEPAEAEQVEQLVAARLLEVARTKPWRPLARALAAYALDRLPPSERRAAASAFTRARATAPVVDVVRRGARSAANAAGGVPALRALEQPAKRSRLARRVYGKLVGGGGWTPRRSAGSATRSSRAMGRGRHTTCGLRTTCGRSRRSRRATR